jgi:putative transposase
VDYIYINPLKHGYVNAPVDWPYSSIHRYIRQGLMVSDWAVDINAGGFGER